MKEVTKFFGLREGEAQVCNGYTFECVKKVNIDKAAPDLYGKLTTPSGDVIDYTNKAIKAHKLNSIAGVAKLESIPAKVENSQQKGESKVVSVSSDKLGRQHRKVMRALGDIQNVLNNDNIAALVHDVWFMYANEQKAAIKAAKERAERLAKERAEAAAAKEAAKREAEAEQKAAELEVAINNLIKYAGMTREQAEAAVKA
jgi:hypothetical protein